MIRNKLYLNLIKENNLIWNKNIYPIFDIQLMESLGWKIIFQILEDEIILMLDDEK
jgi:hypothetical protein